MPVPTRWLIEEGLIHLPVLDYGCGKCHEINNKFFPCDGYDPYYRPIDPPYDKKYLTIICNYVLCALPRNERLVVLKNIQNLLLLKGIAYISVRNDKPKQGWGITKRGTYQGRAENITIPMIYKNNNCRIYRLTRNDKLV